jgi:hypothetical protein
MKSLRILFSLFILCLFSQTMLAQRRKFTIYIPATYVLLAEEQEGAEGSLGIKYLGTENNELIFELPADIPFAWIVEDKKGKKIAGSDIPAHGELSGVIVPLTKNKYEIILQNSEYIYRRKIKVTQNEPDKK